jgi:hypothetical protein
MYQILPSVAADDHDDDVVAAGLRDFALLHQWRYFESSNSYVDDEEALALARHSSDSTRGIRQLERAWSVWCSLAKYSLRHSNGPYLSQSTHPKRRTAGPSRPYFINLVIGERVSVWVSGFHNQMHHSLESGLLLTHSIYYRFNHFIPVRSVVELNENSFDWAEVVSKKNLEIDDSQDGFSQDSIWQHFYNIKDSEYLNNDLVINHQKPSETNTALYEWMTYQWID